MPFVPAIGRGVEHPGGHFELEVTITERDQPVDVPFVQTFVRQSDDLHVLLRHRLLLKPGGFEGLVPRNEHLQADDRFAIRSRYC
jgi:hypothetical protein